jgi:predicted dienelactone hydrolase
MVFSPLNGRQITMKNIPQFRVPMTRIAALVVTTFLYIPQAISQTRYSAGFQQSTLTTAAGETMDVAIWYPTKAEEKPLTLGPTTMTVAFNAATFNKKLPLAVLSHGTGGMSLNHHEIAAATARAGFIAIALTHPGDNYKDRSLVGKLPYFTERPRQITRMLDTILASSDWAPLIDDQRIAFIGHSAGGFTGLALLGATPSIGQTMKHCAANYDDDLWFCRVSGNKKRAIANAGNGAFIPAIESSKDTRFKAAVLIAPVGAFTDGPSLALVNTPTMVYIAAKDDVLVPKFHAQVVGAGIRGAKVITNNDGGHFMLVSKLNVPTGTSTGISGISETNGAQVNDDPPGFNRSAAIAEASATIPKWLNENLPQR